MRRTGIFALIVVLGATSVVVALVLRDLDELAVPSEHGHPAAVEVAPVEVGTIELRRTFTGTLEARGRFVVASNVGGRVERLLVDLADPVKQGQVIAELDDAEQTQDVAEASASLAVMRANLASAKSTLEIAERELQRMQSLNERGLASDSDLDTARARHLARKTEVTVAEAQLRRATASYRRAGVLSGYTKVVADWSGEDKTRVVAERHVAEGDTVAPNEPLVTVVDLHPLTAVIHVTERDYGLLRSGQEAVLTTEAYPDKIFSGAIRRVAPVFHESSRQARMELEVPNPDGLLKPGMFVRAQIMLDRAEDATIVPVAALATRDGKRGVFVVDQDGSRVAWREVNTGIQQGDRVQVLDAQLEGRVVTLGHQLISDGAAITIPQGLSPASSEGS